MSSSTRKQAPRLAKPAVRYWKGKAPKGLTEVDSDLEDDSVSQVTVAGREESGQTLEEEEDVSQSSEYEPDSYEKPQVEFRPVFIPVTLPGREESLAGREESSQTLKEDEDVSQSSEYESDSDEEPQVEFRPVFIPKSVVQMLFCSLISLLTRTIR
jgi:microfibrillar-associated protein 1